MNFKHRSLAPFCTCLFKTSSNHTAYLMKFDGKNVITEKKPIDISTFFPAS